LAVSEVRRDLFRPPVRRVGRVGPPDREVVERLRSAEGVHLRRQELRRLEMRDAVEREQLVEGSQGVPSALGPLSPTM
jgi:hypothetical protein